MFLERFRDVSSARQQLELGQATHRIFHERFRIERWMHSRDRCRDLFRDFGSEEVLERLDHILGF